STTDTTIANQCAGVELEPDNTSTINEPSLQEVAVQYTHILTNTGNYIDTFTMTVGSNAGWRTTVSPAAPEVDANESLPVTVIGYVLAEEYDMTDATVGAATSAFNPEVYETAQETTIVARPHFQLFPDYTREVRGGVVVTNTHMLLN